MSQTPQRKKMGVVQLTILTMVNMMGSGIIMLPTKLAEVGTVSILSWLVTATGATLLAYAFAMAGRYSKRPGGMGGYSEYAFGKAGNFTANFTYFISLVIANIAIAISAVGYALSFMQIDSSKMANGPVIVGLLTIATLWLATVLNFGGASITGKISSITIWGVIIPVFFMCIFGWFWFDGSLWAASWNPHGYNMFEAISMSISMTLWAFLGLESASANSDAVENPEKNVPRAVLFGTIGAAVLYIVSTNVIAGIVDNAALASSDGPFGLVFSQMFNPLIGRIVLGLMVISCFGSLLGWQFTIAEVARSMALVRMFPKWFTKLSKNGAPILGMVIITAVQTLITFMTMSPELSKQFEVLVNLAVVTNVMPYILSMAALAAMMFAEKVPAKTRRTTVIVAFISLLYSLYALYAAGAEAFVGGCLVTFLGWGFFGLIVPKLIKQGEMHLEPIGTDPEALAASEAEAAQA